MFRGHIGREIRARAVFMSEISGHGISICTLYNGGGWTLISPFSVQTGCNTAGTGGMTAHLLTAALPAHQTTMT